MSADHVDPGPHVFAACPTCGTINLSPTEIAESRPFLGIPIPTSEEIDNDPQYADLLLLEPRSMYDQCIVGVVRRFNDRFVLYSQDCVLNAMTESMIPEGGDAWTEAVEFFEYNTIGAWVGEHTPGFLEGEGE